MLKGYGTEFNYQSTDYFFIQANTTVEKKVRTYEQFKCCTGIVHNRLFIPANQILYNNLIVGVKQRNKYLINPIPASLFFLLDNVNLLDNFLRFNGQAEGEDIVFVITNKNAIDISIDFTLLLENEKYNQIYQYDYESVDLSPAIEHKLSLNNKCKHIDKLILLPTTSSTITGAMSIKDRTVFFLQQMPSYFIANIYKEISAKRLISIDIPVTELFLLTTGVATNVLCNFVYRYIPKDSVGISKTSPERAK